MLSRSLKNLGTFSTSYMEEQAHNVFTSYALLNGIDTNAYPELEEFSKVCENFIFNMCNVKNKNEFKIFATTGSSEAIVLGMYFLKQYWQRLLFNGGAKKPNIILSSHSHITWQRAAELLDIQIKILPMLQDSLIIDTKALSTVLDENTIAVCCTVGSPTTLCFDDVKEINRILEQYNLQYNIYVPIHVDAASGGFVLPFVYPEFNWSFNLAHVYSINISSHKYGLIYPSLGWLLMRKIICPDSYAFKQDYLGKTIHTYGIRFSHTAAHLATQHYYIQTKEYAGYKNIINKLFFLVTILKYYLSQIDEILFLYHQTNAQLPGIVFTLNTSAFSLHQLTNDLRQYGWIVPVYRLPCKNQIIVARIVLRYGMTEEAIQDFIIDLKNTIGKLTRVVV
jgi:glutamate decarboxylase